jgi:HEAT repeat protein
MENPFNPFSPLATSAQDIAADRSALVDRIMARLADQQLPFAVAAGNLGVGKSTLLRVQLASRLQRDGWIPILVIASPGLSIEELLLQVATSLGYGFSTVFERLGVRGPQAVYQRIGSVTDSKDIALLQAHFETGAKDAKPWSPLVAASALQEIVRSKGARIALLLDQSEHLFLTPQHGTAIMILESIVRAVSAPDNRLGAVVAIRDEYLYHLLTLAGPFPHITSGIVAIGGLQAEDAAAFVSRALDSYGASFSEKLLQTIIRRLSGISGTVWPIALHACCRPLAELSKKRKKPASVGDLKKLGDLSGIVGAVVVSGIRASDPPLADDAIFCLYVISDVCRREGQIAFEQLVQALPAFPIEDVSRMVRLFRTLRLIEEPRSGYFRLAHDSLAAAVHGLRHAAQTEEDVRSLDRAVAIWGASDEYLTSDQAKKVLSALREGLPTPHVLLIAGSLFNARTNIDPHWLAQLRTVLSKPDPRQLIHLVTEHAARHGRGPALRPGEVFVLALSGTSAALAAAMVGLLSASRGPCACWSENDYTDALWWSSPALLGQWLATANLSNSTSSALRCIVRVLLQRPEIPVELSVLSSLWEHAASVIKPELLGLIASRFSAAAADLALECSSHSESYLRAAAADVAKMLEPGAAKRIIGQCLRDKVATVRRRGIFAINQQTFPMWETLLLDLLDTDPSPLVREACLEVIGRLSISHDCRAHVQSALQDQVDFVRESAVYALAHLMSASEAAEAVAPLVRDEAPKVREASIRLLSAAHAKPPTETVLNDLRSGPPSLRVAAAELLTYAASPDVDMVLEQIISDEGTDRDTLMASLRVAGRRRSSLCLPSIAACLSAPDVGVVCEAILALTSMGTPDSVALLESSAFHVSVDVRERTVYALAELGGAKAVSILTGCLSDPRDEIRVRAIFALGRLQAAEAWARVNAVSPSTPQLREAIAYYTEQVRDKPSGSSGGV